MLKRDEITFEREVVRENAQNMWGESYERETTMFNFEIPFDGEEDVFQLSPSQSDSAPPHGSVQSGILGITVKNEDDPQRIQRAVNSVLDDVDRYLGWHRAMFQDLGINIEVRVRQHLVQRRQKLASAQSTEAGLAGLGFK